MARSGGTSSRREGRVLKNSGSPKQHPHDERRCPWNESTSASTFTRRRSVIVRKSSDGELLSKVHIDNDPITMAQAVVEAGPEPDVVLEATFGWYWAADLLADGGARVHLAPEVAGGGALCNYGLFVSSDYKSAGQSTFEPEVGFEPTTCSLRVSCSAGLSYPGGLSSIARPTGSGGSLSRRSWRRSASVGLRTMASAAA